MTVEGPFLELEASSRDTATGQDAGSTVVLVGHPALPVQQWTPLGSYLAQHHLVYASRDPFAAPDGRGDVPTLVDRLGADLEERGHERVHLVGAEGGGRLIQAFAARFADRVRSLSLLSSHAGGDHETPSHGTHWERFLGGCAKEADPPTRHYALVEATHELTLRRRPEAFDALLEMLDAGAWSARELARRREALADLCVFDELVALELPILLLHGALDPLVPPDNARTLELNLPGAERIELADTGHLFFLEDPGTTYAALRTFLQRVDAFVP